MVRMPAAMIGCEAKARALAARLQEGLLAVGSTSAVLRRRPRVYFEEWDDPLISGIRWVSELIAMAGGEDCFPELAGHSLGRDRIIADPLEVGPPRPRHHSRLVVREEIPSGAGARASGLGGGTCRA